MESWNKSKRTIAVLTLVSVIFAYLAVFKGNRFLDGWQDGLIVFSAWIALPVLSAINGLTSRGQLRTRISLVLAVIYVAIFSLYVFKYFFEILLPDNEIESNGLYIIFVPVILTQISVVSAALTAFFHWSRARQARKTLRKVPPE